MKSFISIAVLFLFVLSSCIVNDVSDDTTSSILLRVKIGEKYGFINESGDVVIEPQYDDAYLYFSEGVCFAVLDGKKGLINENGCFQVELPDSINMVFGFKNGLSLVEYNNGGRNIIDTNGSLLLDSCYNTIFMDENGVAFYLKTQNDKWFVTNKNGVIISESLNNVGRFCKGLCPIEIKGKYGYIDTCGRISIDTIYNNAKSFSEDGIARVKKDGREYFIDTTGRELFSVNKTRTGLECNRAAIEIDGKLALIDRNKKKICIIEADKIFGFNKKDSLATIIRDGNAIKIDTLGREVVSTKYETIGYFFNGVAIVKRNDKYGLISKQGKEIIGLEYDAMVTIEIDSINRIIIALCKNGEVSYFDRDGKFIGKDMGLPDVTIPENATKEDFIKYFDAKLADLSLLEGIYYVTIRNYYESRENINQTGLNDSNSKFYAIIKDPSTEEYWAYCTDGSNNHWVNKFVRIGETNNYAILKIDKDNDYSSEGSMTLDNPNSFAFRLEQGNNIWNNFFVTYEFVRDYPPVSELEKIQKAEWTGSGFAIADGYVVTNYHVTSGAKNIRVKGIDGDMDKAYKAVVVAYDKEHDISIVRIVDKEFKHLGVIPYTIGKSMVDIGEEVFVLGYPLIDSMGTEIKLTEGTISSTSGFQGNKSMYQISAAVQPGNSGGPVFNEDGVVIGIVCGKHSDAENANYAIKISYLYSLLNKTKLDIDLADNKLNKGKLSKKVKKVKDFVYLIECNANN